ncbi:MAG TPA: PIN domain-containing protein [Opitutaceae bacterium]|jgi:predicted nucleic acid-binding protein|nr:PIN domain-containing protein [Opitutaceae bacterium]
MGELVLPDSNFFINRARTGVDPFIELAARADDWEFATCGMVVVEVCRGRRDPAVFQRFRERFAIMIYVPTGNSVWERAAQLAWSLDRKGVVLPAPDLLIAACALQADATVLTADAHFQAIPGLRVIDHLG